MDCIREIFVKYHQVDRHLILTEIRYELKQFKKEVFRRTFRECSPLFLYLRQTNIVYIRDTRLNIQKASQNEMNQFDHYTLLIKLKEFSRWL